MHIYVWCCDFRNFTGEGNLARNFLAHIAREKNKKFIIFSPQGIWTLNKSLHHRKSFFKSTHINPYFMDYFYPFIGIFFLWIFFLLGKRTLYLNYCPLWNFFIFMLSPPKNIFGPITGSIYKGKVINLSTFIRKFIFIIFFKISLFFICLRKFKIILSTSLLVNFLKKKNFLFFENYQILSFFIYKKRNSFDKKDIDLIFYNRKHDFKNNNHFKNIICKLDASIKIYVVGDIIKDERVINIGSVNNDTLMKYFSRTRYIFSSSENLYSFFNMEALFFGAKVIYSDMNYEQSLIFNRKNFFYIKNNSSFLFSLNKLLKIKSKESNKLDFKMIKKFNKRFNFFIEDSFI
jgi:hypothetical protein